MKLRNTILSMVFLLFFTLSMATIPIANPTIQSVPETNLNSLATYNILWNTTSDFNNFASNNCTIESGQLSLKKVNIAYDFTDDTIGEAPTGWTVEEVNEPSPDMEVKVTASKGGHSKVMEIWDNSSPSMLSIYQTFADQVTGTVEFWIYGIEGSPDVSWGDVFSIHFMSSSLGTENFQLRADWESRYDTLTQYGTSDIIVGSGNFTSDTWHHLRVWWNCTSDIFKVWHNGVYKGQYNMRYTFPDDVDSIMFQTDCSYSMNNFYVYLDAIDYSWTSGYYTNRSYDRFGEKYYNQSVWISAVQDLGVSQPYYNNLTFSGQTNANTAIYISYQESPNGIGWNGWSAWTTSNISIDKNGKRYFQVRILLTTNDALETPVLDWINFCYHT